MVRLSPIVATLLTGASALSAVKDLLPTNFDDIVLKSGKPALVEFFAPWCGHCKTLAPIYDELAGAFEFASDKVTIGKVDADDHKDLGRKFGVQGFPTLKWFDGKSDTPEDYKGGRDLESLTAFITSKTSLKPKTPHTAPPAVQMLTDSTFSASITGSKHALVAFTAPWCGHCKTLAPTWEKLATDFVSEKEVLIAKVDCEAPNAKATAQEAGVKSYPTIFYYPEGSTTGVPYSGGRSEEDLVTFINEKAGTYRAVGGGLNPLAGTVPSLNSIVETLKSGGASAYAEFEKAVGAAGDKYAEYYGKVAKKSEENAGYVEKEYTRLQGLLKKGGLSTDKVDDLVRRSNVLSVFRGGEQGKTEL
ncbi:Protein disulfide-isomerase tigA [Cryoendolithus antarcticus]|uniref:protein disulfide-isomerase n=1 Tax=Cryoendolithus antarcticus TaxID=1507870 RepID=A0A1V8TT07_9PEZI|nr:Protein disulfide-isomerase tigA [Cryoendolithus antarcticus]